MPPCTNRRTGRNLPEKNFAPYVTDDVLFRLKAVSAHLSARHTKEVIARMREKRWLNVIAEETVGARAYHKPRGEITREKSKLRSWLNGEYFTDGFSAKEQPDTES